MNILIKAVIIDDERSGRQVLRQMLELYCTDVEVTAVVDSADEGKKAISQHHPDVVFLDIEMPFQSGFEFLRTMKKIDFQVVFVSAHQRYIEEARQFSPLGFLLKPVNLRELRMMVERMEGGFH